eukprot:COSAG01_NODE_3835_length_5649_cov_36.487474_9_plen_173_part_00
MARRGRRRRRPAPPPASRRAPPRCRRAAVQNGGLSRRGGCPNRWHSLVKCDHGDSTAGRFDSDSPPPPAGTCRAHPAAWRPGSTGQSPRSASGTDNVTIGSWLHIHVMAVSGRGTPKYFRDKNRRYIGKSQSQHVMAVSENPVPRPGPACWGPAAPAATCSNRAVHVILVAR